MAYTFTGRKSGTVRFEATDNGVINKESECLTSRVTSNPIESGGSLNDHVINDAQKFTVDGVIIGGNAAIAALKNMRDKRDIVTYTGRVRVSNLVFTSLTFNYDPKNKDGATFKAQLQQVIISTAQTVDVGSVPMSAQAKKTANAGTQSIVTEYISGSAYSDYVKSYNGDSSSGPTQRQTDSYNGIY